MLTDCPLKPGKKHPAGTPTPEQFFSGVVVDGRRFCCIKASEVGLTAAGKRYESRSVVYAGRYRIATSLGIRSHGYHYALPSTDLEDARYQARMFAAVTGPWRNNDLPPWLDFEAAAPELTCRQLVAWIHAFMGEATKLLGCCPDFYSYLNFIHERLSGPDAVSLAQYNLILACYCGNTPPHAPKPWSDWRIWQRTGTGRRPFFAGDLDLDVYAGTPEQLDAYCRRSAT